MVNSNESFTTRLSADESAARGDFAAGINHVVKAPYVSDSTTNRCAQGGTQSGLFVAHGVSGGSCGMPSEQNERLVVQDAAQARGTVHPASGGNSAGTTEHHNSGGTREAGTRGGKGGKKGVVKMPFDHLPKTGGVYRMTNTVTDDCYVGGSYNLHKRAAQHDSFCRSQCHHSARIQKLYDEHGPQSFRFEVLELCEDADIDDKEREWIKRLNPSLNGHAGIKPLSERMSRKRPGLIKVNLQFCMTPKQLDELDEIALSEYRRRSPMANVIFMFGLVVARKMIAEGKRLNPPREIVHEEFEAE